MRPSERWQGLHLLAGLADERSFLLLWDSTCLSPCSRAQVQAAVQKGHAPAVLAEARSFLLQRDFYLFTAERLAASRTSMPCRAPPALALAV